MKRLQSLIAKVEVPLGAVQNTGVLTVGEDSVFRFASMMASSSMLIGLSEWVNYHLAQYPSVAHLKDAEIYEVDGEGTILSTYKQPQLWSQVPFVSVKGCIGESIHRLASMPVGKEAWFWLSDRGPGKQAFIEIYPSANDKEGEMFAKHCSDIRKRIVVSGNEMFGVLRNDPDYGLCFICQNKGEHWQDLITALIDAHKHKYPAIKLLTSSSLVRMRKGAVIDRVQYLSPPVSPPERVAEVLSQFDKSQPALYFWFQVADGKRTLLVEKDLAVLKKQLQEITTDGLTARGRVRETESHLVFSVTRAKDFFLEALIDWTQEYIEQWPELIKLVGARLLVTAKGAVVQEYELDELWDAIT